MKLWHAFALGTAAVLCAFLLHIGAMRPSEAELCRAEALDYLLIQETEAAEQLLPYLSGEAQVRSLQHLPALDGNAIPVGNRMVGSAGRLYYIQAETGQVVEFRLPGTA